MKTFYILFFLFLGTSAAVIAQDTTDVVDQIVFYRADSTAERYSYHHTWSKDLTNIQLVETFKNGHWENNRRYNYNADSNEFVIKTSRENWIEGQWVLNFYQTDFYDTKWNLVISLYEEWDKGKRIRSGKTIYDNTYDTKGNIWIAIIQDLQNGEYVNSERTTRTFNSNEKLLVNLEEYWSGGQWVASTKEAYTYDTNSNQLTDQVDFWEKGVLAYTSFSTRTYDSNNKVLIFLHEGIEDGIISSSYRYTYTYDSKGNELTYLYEEFENDVWSIISRKTRTYDNNSKELTYVYEGWKDGVWHFIEKETHVYDTKGNTLSYLHEKWEAGVLTYSGRYTYSYDSEGKVLIDLYELFKENKWVNSSRETYEYASNGKNNLHIYEYWKNDQWVRGEFYSAVIDNKGNITSDTTSKGSNESYSGKYTYDNFGNILTSNKVQTKNGKLYKKYRINYTYNANGHLLTFQNEECVDDKWSNVDVWFSFEDSKKNRFGNSAYRFEVTYKTITPVKDGTTVSGFSLNCSPNPSPGPLNINYTLTEPALISISISNIMGIEMANISQNQFQLPGTYHLNYDASNLTPGAYFITVKAGNKSETKKILINY